MIGALLACGSPAAVPPPAAPAPVPEPAVESVAVAVGVSPGPDLVGLCDASAAVVVGPFLVVADDERNTLSVFRADGFAPVQRLDLADLSPRFDGKEADLEGMTTDAHGVVWAIGSHDAGKDTEPKESRQRLVALRLTEQGDGLKAELVGVTSGLLEQGGEETPLADVLPDTRGRPAKDPRGLSIEGLSVDGTGRLLVGFRAPVVAGKALVERIDDPDGFVAGAPPKLTGPRWAPLDGRGIRAMEWTGDPARPEELLVVAGPPGGGGDFALYRWAGFDDRAAPATKLPVSFRDLTPEALVRIGGDWWVLSDDGRRSIGGRDCKDLPRDERRARTATIPASVVSGTARAAPPPSEAAPSAPTSPAGP